MSVLKALRHLFLSTIFLVLVLFNCAIAIGDKKFLKVCPHFRFRALLVVSSRCMNGVFLLTGLALTKPIAYFPLPFIQSDANCTTLLVIGRVSS